MGQIEQLYSMYETIEQGYTNIQTTYDSLQKQYAQLKDFTMNGGWKNISDSALNVGKSFKTAFSNSDGSGISSVKDMFNALSDEQKIMKTRASLISLTHTVSEDVDRYNSLKNNVMNQTASVGGEKISMGGLLGLGKYGSNNIGSVLSDAEEGVKAEIEKAKQNWTDNLSAADKEKIARTYGVSPEVYYEQRLLAEAVNDKVNDAIGKGSDLIKTADQFIVDTNCSGVAALDENAADSMVKHQQATTQAALTIAKETNGVKQAVYDLTTVIGLEKKDEDREKWMELERRNLQSSQNALNRLHYKVPEDQLNTY
jgi:predicted aspartyl protease